MIFFSSKWLMFDSNSYLYLKNALTFKSFLDLDLPLECKICCEYESLWKSKVDLGERVICNSLISTDPTFLHRWSLQMFRLTPILILELAIWRITNSEVLIRGLYIFESRKTSQPPLFSTLVKVSWFQIWDVQVNRFLIRTRKHFHFWCMKPLTKCFQDTRFQLKSGILSALISQS